MAVIARKVYAVGVCAAAIEPTEAAQARAARVEQAMSDAVTQALEDGIAITDTETIRRRMAAAREAALAARD